MERSEPLSSLYVKAYSTGETERKRKYEKKELSTNLPELPPLQKVQAGGCWWPLRKPTRL